MQREPDQARSQTRHGYFLCDIYRDCPRGVHREAKMCKKCAKMANF